VIEPADLSRFSKVRRQPYASFKGQPLAPAMFASYRLAADAVAQLCPFLFVLLSDGQFLGQGHPLAFGAAHDNIRYHGGSPP